MTQTTSDDRNAPRLSIIIPAYNEEKRIGKTLDRLAAFVKAAPYDVEIIVADDGSQDGTAGIVNTFIAREAAVATRLIRAEHRGKGNAIRTGILAASGDYLLYTDADLSTPIERIDDFIGYLEDGKAIVMASREVAGADRLHEPFVRHLVSRIFNLVTRIFTVRGHRDTQCGFKAFPRGIGQDLFRRTVIDRFSFDVELLFLAQKKRLPVQEVPVKWIYGPSSTMKVWRDGILMFLDVLRIRWNDLRGIYDG